MVAEKIVAGPASSDPSCWPTEQLSSNAGTRSAQNGGLRKVRGICAGKNQAFGFTISILQSLYSVYLMISGIINIEGR
jgi:hypothetical protein